MWGLTKIWLHLEGQTRKNLRKMGGNTGMHFQA